MNLTKIICTLVLLVGIWFFSPGCHNGTGQTPGQDLQSYQAMEHDNLKSQLSDMKKSQEQTKAALRTVTEGYQKLKDQSNQDKIQIDELEGNLLTCATESAKIQSQLQEQIKNLTQERDAALAKTQELQTAVNTLNTQMGEKDKNIVELAAQTAEKDKKITDLEAQVQTLQNFIAEIQKKLQDASAM